MEDEIGYECSEMHPAKLKVDSEGELFMDYDIESFDFDEPSLFESDLDPTNLF